MILDESHTSLLVQYPRGQTNLWDCTGIITLNPNGSIAFRLQGLILLTVGT